MAKSKKTLYDVFKTEAVKGFNYPTKKMCSDGDICTYLKSINADENCFMHLIPQKKAKELVSKFQSISGHKRFSIAYAIIAVEEIISQWEYIYIYIGNGMGKLNPNLKYWQDVLKELKKM